MLSNGTWSAAQQGVSVAGSSVIAFLLVLTLPVSEFGVYSYALALVSIGGSVTSGGLNNLAVREIVHHPGRNAALVTALLLIREAFALLAYAIVALVSLTSGDMQTIAATLVAASALFARGADAPELWYRAKMRSRKTAAIRIGVTLVVFAMRLAALWLWPSVELFIVLYVTDAFLAGVLIVARYLRDPQSPGLGRPSFRGAITLTRQSFPLLLSGIANQVNLRGDVVVLQNLLGATSVGIYSAAAKLSELAYFLPVVFMNATFPVMLETRRKHGENSPEYKAFLQRSYDQAFWSGVLVASAIAIGGTVVIDWFFGPAYEESKYVLWVSLIACPFIFMGAVYSKWIIAEGALWSSTVRHAAGAFVNIALNFALIPPLGIVGAAIATLVSYVIASYFACFVGRKSRSAGIQMSLAFFAPVRILLSTRKHGDR